MKSAAISLKFTAPVRRADKKPPAYTGGFFSFDMLKAMFVFINPGDGFKPILHPDNIGIDGELIIWGVKRITGMPASLRSLSHCRGDLRKINQCRVFDGFHFMMASDKLNVIVMNVPVCKPVQRNIF